MFNCLLDGFPTVYTKDESSYRLRTSFRVGILLSNLLEDTTVEDNVKFYIACQILYIDMPDDSDTAMDGIEWFLSLGDSEVHYETSTDDELDLGSNTKSDDKALDFNVDHIDIYAEFRKLGINLLIEDLHWFEFMSVLRNLNSECNLAQKMAYRVCDTSEMKGDTAKFYKKQKERFRIRKQVSKEEYEKMKDEQTSAIKNSKFLNGEMTKYILGR